MGLTANAPHAQLTYRIIGLAMEVHNELGPGHREADYHDALAIKLRNAGLDFLDEPECTHRKKLSPFSARSGARQRSEATNGHRING